MTKKRYHKLFYALMQRINIRHIEVYGKGVDNWGGVLKAAATVNPFPNSLGFTSYKEIWENLMPTRQQYGM